MNRYMVVIEATGTGYSAYSPDLPGCVTAGATRDEPGLPTWKSQHESGRVAIVA